MPKLIFEQLDKEQLEHIHNAEMELTKAGVTFDTGSDVANGIITSRVWELDWSLEGATIEE